MNKCPNCKTKLLTDHAFCPRCGFDLRPAKTPIIPVADVGQPKVTPVEEQIAPVIEDNREVTTGTVIPTVNSKTPLIISVVFTAISIFIWCFAFTNWKFDLNLFMSKLVNNSFWIILVPWLISRFYKKEKRTNVHYNMVMGFVGIGCVLLLFGYFQMKDAQRFGELNDKFLTDPIVIKSELKQPCINSVVPKLAKYKITAQQIDEMAALYCDCILEKLNNDELVSIGTRTKSFWETIEQNHVDDSAICTEKQFSILRKQP